MNLKPQAIPKMPQNTEVRHYSQISDLISAIIIYLCGFVFFLKYAMNKAIAAREEKKALKEKAIAEKASEGGEK